MGFEVKYQYKRRGGMHTIENIRQAERPAKQISKRSETAGECDALSRRKQRSRTDERRKAGPEVSTLPGNWLYASGGSRRSPPFLSCLQGPLGPPPPFFPLPAPTP